MSGSIDDSLTRKALSEFPLKNSVTLLVFRHLDERLALLVPMLECSALKIRRSQKYGI